MLYLHHSMPIKRQIKLSVTLFIANMLVIALPLSAHQVIPTSDPVVVSDSSKLMSVIQNKIAYYNQQYPQIKFVQIDGGIDWQDDLANILMMLGADADALDYQHPAELRETLLSVTIERIRQLLEADIVSATLFRAGHSSTLNRPNLCVITLNPEVFVASDYQATSYMLDLSDEVMQKLHPARYLDHIHHLEFTLDHEAFHCVDSFMNGGAPQTDKELGGEYNAFRRESIADAYALLMHIKKHGDNVRYARNIVHARALWIFSDSPNRCTFETMREILTIDHKIIQNSSVQELIELATHLRNRNVGDYDTYVVQHTAAIHAAEKLGMVIELYGKKWQDLTKIPSNPALIAHLINRYEFYYLMLFNDEVIPLEAPPAHDWKSKDGDS